MPASSGAKATAFVAFVESARRGFPVGASTLGVSGGPYAHIDLFYRFDKLFFAKCQTMDRFPSLSDCLSVLELSTQACRAAASRPAIGC